MASDIPPGSPYQYGSDMAKKLVTYLDDPERVRRAVLDEFATAPTIDSIKFMRREYLRKKARREVQKREVVPYSEGYYPLKSEDEMALISAEFVRLLDAERRRPRLTIF